MDAVNRSYLIERSGVQELITDQLSIELRCYTISMTKMFYSVIIHTAVEQFSARYLLSERGKIINSRLKIYSVRTSLIK